jgi:thiol-disulfide isomerase/thioredoxin
MKTRFCGILLLIVALLLLPGSLSATQGDEKAESLLKTAESTLANMKTLRAEVSGTVTDLRPGRVPTTRYKVRMRLMRPNFAWIDCEEIREEKKGDGTTRVTTRTQIVSTGKTLWKYDPTKQEYTHRPVDPEGRNIDSFADALPVAMPLYMFFNSRVPHMQTPPHLDGTEGSDGVTYQIVEFADKAVSLQRLYFGPDNLLHRMTNSQLEGQYFENWTLKLTPGDAPLTASDFAFAPPATAKDRTRPAPALLAAGTDAPDFTVTDPAGKPIKLSHYRGKVVVLDFWSTGCGHSLESRAHMNAIARKFGKEAVFLSVHVWDTKEAFLAWLPKHPQFDKLTFTVDTAAVGKDVATTLYQVPGLPTHYVIGKDGKIRNGFLGYSGPTADLETAIRKAIGGG